MKIFTFLSFLFVLKEVSSAALNLNDSKPSYDELKRQNLEMFIENAEVRIENGKLKLALHEISEKKNTLTKELNLNYINCSALSSESGFISNNLKKLTDDVEHFNTFVDTKLAEYESKYGIVDKSATVSQCEQKKWFMFIDKTLYEKVCDLKTTNGGWTVIQRRLDGKTNFYRPWSDYKVGFGTITGEFFIGLEGLHLLTTCHPQELLIEMEDFQNQKRYAKYDLFEIGNEHEKYVLKKLGVYAGDAGDSLDYHKSKKFSTYDQDNDGSSINCAQKNKGAWWFDACHNSDLNGEYGNNKKSEGINWNTFRGYEYSLKMVEMKIRPKY